MKAINRGFCFIITLIMLICSIPLSYAANDVVVYSEDYMSGGLGVAYNDTNGKDIELGWMNAEFTYMVIMRGGEWVKYEVEAPSDGMYDVTFLLGRGESGKTHMTIENETLQTTLTELIDNTGDYLIVDEFAMGQIMLKKGKNTVKVSLESGAIYFELMKFSPYVDKSTVLDFSQTQGAYRKNFLPGVVEAEDFDIGLDGSLSEDGKNKGKAYRKEDAIDIYETQKNSKEYYIDISTNEWTEYTVICTYDGIYDIYSNFFKPGILKIFIDGNETPITVNSKGLTGEAFGSSVYLKKGTHKIRISSASGVASIDKIVIMSSENTENVFYADMDYTQKEETPIQIKNDIYKSYYVSQNGDDNGNGSKENPFKTINRARDEVRKVNKEMTGDIYVYIDPGYYKQDETLRFTDDDGGKNGFNVVYTGSDPFSETVIGGGIHITDWEKTDNEIYKAHLDTKNDVRNMYINDVPAQRARSKYIYQQTEFFKKENSKYTYDGMKFPRKNFPKEFYDPERLEIVYDILWCNHRVHADEIIFGENDVTFLMKQPYFDFLVNTNTGPVSNGGSPYFENDLALLDEPGEFYYDIKNETIYYFPRENESLDEVYVADTEFLMEVRGTGLDNKVENLSFERLSFKHSAWYGLNEGTNSSQAERVEKIDSEGKKTDVLVPAEIEVEYAKNVNFKNCIFIGHGTVALAMRNAVSHSEITGNIFKDTAGAAINVGHFDHLNKLPEGQERVNNILIKNNVIRRNSYEIHHHCAITLYYVNSVKVLNNDIRDIPYTAISMGWGWGMQDVIDCANNEIAYNRIENVLSPIKDGAHIYTLGPVRNTTIHDNYLNKAFDYEGGLYFDQGSAYMKAYNNVSSGNRFWLFARANAGLKQLEVYNNYADKTTASIDELNVNVYDNFFETDYEKKGWSKEAQAIIDASGVEGPYKRLLDSVELPDYAQLLFRTTPKTSFAGRNDWVMPGSYTDFYKPDGTFPVVDTDGTVGFTIVGEWEEYEVKIRDTGIYTLTLQAGNGAEGHFPKAKIYIDGKVVNEGIDVPNFVKGKWTVGDIHCGEFFLDKGTHTIRIEQIDSNFLLGPFKFSMGEESVVSDSEYDEGKLPSEIAKDEIVFNDIVNHWAESSIMSLYNQNLIKGTSENEFSPEKEITLYETMLIVARILNESKDKVGVLLSQAGYQDRIDTVNIPVTRLEFCDIIMKLYASYKGNYKMIADYNVYSDFSDIEAEFYPCVWGASDLGLFKGDNENRFNPYKTLTRAEAATVINRLSFLIK